MILVMLGLSYRTAALPILESASVPPAELRSMLTTLRADGSVSEAMVLSTCNRVEIYAVVSPLNAGLACISGALAARTGLAATQLAGSVYVHAAESVVAHLFSVAAGLDSMVVGEAQILGQVRAAYSQAQEAASVGTLLHELAQRALRVGKRVRAETGIDRAGASVVSEALAEAEIHLGRLAGKRALIVGAGSVSNLAAAHLRKAGIGEVVIANRTATNGSRLAGALCEMGVKARWVGLGHLLPELAEADVVLGCAAAAEVVISAEQLRAALSQRDPKQTLVFCDLGLPRNVDVRSAEEAGVHVVDLDTLRHRLSTMSTGQEVNRATAMVAAEVRAFVAGRRATESMTTVRALRHHLEQTAAGELKEFTQQTPQLSPDVHRKVDRSMARFIDKLLLTPTLRMKELSTAPGGTLYADVLRELFEFGPEAEAEGQVDAASFAEAPGPLSSSTGLAPLGAPSSRQIFLALDMEGVLTPEIWVAVAERMGIPELRTTTRDEPDYEVLMNHRLALIRQHAITLPALLEVVRTLTPLAGAREFLDAARSRLPVVLLSDTFVELAQPLLEQLGWPTLLCHRLRVEQDRIAGYELRVPDHKRLTVLALQGLNFRVIAAGDSFNDARMLSAADEAYLFRPPERVRTAFPQFPVLESFETLLQALHVRA